MLHYKSGIIYIVPSVNVRARVLNSHSRSRIGVILRKTYLREIAARSQENQYIKHCQWIGGDIIAKWALHVYSLTAWVGFADTPQLNNIISIVITILAMHKFRHFFKFDLQLTRVYIGKFGIVCVIITRSRIACIYNVPPSQSLTGEFRIGFYSVSVQGYGCHWILHVLSLYIPVVVVGHVNTLLNLLFALEITFENLNSYSAHFKGKMYSP